MTEQRKITLVWIAAGGVLGLLVVGRISHERVLQGVAGLSGFDAASLTVASGLLLGCLASWLGWPPGELSERLKAGPTDPSRANAAPIKVPAR